MKTEKARIDVLMVEKGLAESREKAKSILMSGNVYIGEVKFDKPGMAVPVDSEITVRQRDPYVSRGGHKLEKAMQCFSLNLNEKICMDVGASTGGFTDCMLQNGAAKVYAVDVGYGQLAWKLRTDDRVVNLERTNIRYLDPALIIDELDFVSIDVAFISLKLVLPVLKELLNDGKEIVALIKPQFEAGREKVGKKGVVRDLSVHKEVCHMIADFALEAGFSVTGFDFSPIKGPEGNIEYLIHLVKGEAQEMYDLSAMDSVVEKSHTEL